MPCFASIACALCLPLALGLRLLHQVQDLQRPRQLCLSWLRHLMRHAPLGGVGQPPQRLVRAGHSQEQQEALVSQQERLAEQQETLHAIGRSAIIIIDVPRAANQDHRRALHYPRDDQEQRLAQSPLKTSKPELASVVLQYQPHVIVFTNEQPTAK